jgi:hypothetical protein
VRIAASAADRAMPPPRPDLVHVETVVVARHDSRLDMI